MVDISTTGELRARLQSLLDDKEKQLQHAGTLGQRVLEQQMELEERISQLRDLDAERDEHDEVGAEVREHFRALAEMVRAWDSENVKLSDAFVDAPVKHSPIQSFSSDFSTIGDLSRDEPERGTKAGAQSAAKSRREKNAAHRQNDVEFAFEIGSGLLTEVRRLQSLLGERDKAIQDMKEEKDDLEKSVEALRTALRQQEQSADKFREENWNQEVQLQEIRVQLNETQATAQRLEGEQKRLTKALNSSREASDHHKTEAERVQGALDELKAKHETDVAQARKHAAGLQRDKVDLQQTLDATKAELARQSRRLLPRFGTPHTPGGAARNGLSTPAHGDDDDVFGGAGAMSTRARKGDLGLFGTGEFGEFPADDEPEMSPSRPRFLTANHPSSELEALQQKLAHAQRQIGTLKSTLQREKEQKIEYRRKLEAAPVVAPVAEEDDTWEDDGIDEGGARIKARKITPFKSGRGRGRGTARGRGRGRGGLSLSDRFALAGQSPGSEYGTEYDGHADSPPPPVPSLPMSARDIFDEDEEENIFGGPNVAEPPSPSPSHVPSNRTSVDGMDPAFANVLRRATSINGAAIAGSPLRQSAVPRGGTLPRRRGGAAFQEARRQSFQVGQPGALALELGMGGEDSMFKELSKVETKEFACQTEPEEERSFVGDKTIPAVEPAPAPAPVVKSVSEMGIQVEPEPVPVVAPHPPPVMAEMSSQTEPEPKLVRSEMAVQHDFVAPPLPLPPVRVDSGMLTDAEEKEVPVARVQRDADTQTPLPPVEPIRVDSGMLTEAEEKAVPVALVQRDANTQTPLPPVEPIRMDSGMLTDAEEKVVPVALVQHDANTQTLPPPTEPVVTKSDADTQTTIFQAPVLARIRTSSVSASSDEDEHEERPRRTTLTQRDLQQARLVAATASADSTMTVSGRPVRQHGVLAESDNEDDGTQTETETGDEADTDADDYHDARSAGVMTPSTDFRVYLNAEQGTSLHTHTDSVNDFHSIMTVTDNDFSDSEQGSIRASVMSSRNASKQALSIPPSPVESTLSSISSAGPPPPTYEEKGVFAEIIIEEPKVEVPVLPAPPPPPPVVKEEPKPVLKEMCIQTDDWMPPPPPRLASIPSSPSSLLVPIPIPVSPSQPGPVRLGSSQQFQFVAPSPTTPTRAAANVSHPTPTGTPIRDHSLATIRPRTSMSERRQSIESAMSSLLDESGRVRTSSMIIDKSRPPVMMLPPPPRLPPPPKSAPSPSSVMPPPSFIPEHRRVPAASNASDEGPPPRPSSPPPPELIKRATTPLLGVPTRSIFGPRQHGSSTPATQTNIRQLPSTSSFRSAAAAMQQSGPSSLLAPVSMRSRRELSSTSLASGGSVGSPRSSISSDHGLFAPRAQNGGGTPQRPDFANRSSMAATDPAVIHSITQTMIGEFLYKYTRRAIGRGHGERRHKRFFWVHPYTKTLYWGSADPGSANVSESTAKSAFIDGVRSVLDPNPMPPGLYQYSIVVSTPQREMKFTAPTKERHDIWFNALQYLLTRPNATALPSPANGPQPLTPFSANSGSTPEEPYEEEESFQNADLSFNASPQSQRSARRSMNTTPRGRRSASQLSFRGSIGKRAGTPAAEYLRWQDAPYSSEKSFEHGQEGGAGHPDEDEEDEEDEELDFELNDASLSDGGFEGLENVRACCDGKHTVGHSHQHPHHHDGGAPVEQPSPTRAPSRSRGRFLNTAEDAARPISPSGWSLRSRTGSTHSTGLFARFGSMRSTKTSVDR